MNLIILALLILAILLVLFWLIKKEKTKEDKIPSYVCPECGEHHCNCYLEKMEE